MIRLGRWLAAGGYSYKRLQQRGATLQRTRSEGWLKSLLQHFLWILLVRKTESKNV